MCIKNKKEREEGTFPVVYDDLQSDAFDLSLGTRSFCCCVWDFGCCDVCE